MRTVLAVLIVVLWLGLTIGAALAHDHGPGSWINQQSLKDPISGEPCCNLNDCAPTKVREVAGGYIVETGEFIPHQRVIWRSQDGQWWRCRVLMTMHGPNVNATRCLIGPPPGF